MGLLALVLLAGVFAGYARAARAQHGLIIPDLVAVWLVPVSVLPQVLVFFLPGTERLAGYGLSAAVLVTSQGLLLLFVWLNRKNRSLCLLGLGLGLNLSVILINGGLMPISPETIYKLDPTLDVSQWAYGERLGGSKDQLLPETETKLAIFADRIVPPSWFPLRAAFSLGDLVIAAGIFLFFWDAGRTYPTGALSEG